MGASVRRSILSLPRSRPFSTGPLLPTPASPAARGASTSAAATSPTAATPRAASAMFAPSAADHDPLFPQTGDWDRSDGERPGEDGFNQAGCATEGRFLD